MTSDLAMSSICALKRAQIENLVKNRVAGTFDFGGICIVISPQSRILTLSCSGFVPQGQVIYAAENTSQRINTNKIFICDKENLWYYEGIYTVSQNFSETIDLIGVVSSLFDVDLRCALGTSGGGYMALIVAALLGFDRALALSPQTTLDPKERATMEDTRFEPNNSVVSSKHSTYDVARLEQANKRSRNYIIYPAHELLDSAHARRLQNKRGFYFYPIETAEHNVSAFLANKNKLLPCIDAFIHSTSRDCADAILNAIL